MLVLTFITVVVLVYIIQYVWDGLVLQSKLKSFRRPPQHFLLGHGQNIMNPEDTVGYFSQCLDKYGKLVHLNATIAAPFVLISDADLVNEILQNAAVVDKASAIMKGVTEAFGYGIVSKEAHDWAKIRKITNPSFHYRILEQFMPLFDKAGKDLVTTLSQNLDKPLNIMPYLSMCTLKVVQATTMGNTPFKCDSERKYEECFKKALTISAKRFIEPWKLINILYYFTQDYWSFRKNKSEMLTACKELLDGRRKYTKHIEEGTDEFGRKTRLVLLDQLLATKMDGKPLEDEQLMYEVSHFVGAGHETIATELGFFCYLMANNLDKQEKVFEELRTVLKDDVDKEITPKDLTELKYLEMAIKESMRLYPALALITRELKKDQYFGKVFIPARVPILIAIDHIHKNPEYHEEPEKFLPERFDPSKTIRPGTYLPFSLGPRNCIGQKYAMMELKILVANILRKFKILPVPERKPILVFNFTTTTNDGLYVRFAQRSH